MKEVINILCATDDNYVPYCGIMLTSVFENNLDVAIDVYIMVDKPLKQANLEKFSALCARYDSKAIRYILVDPKRFSLFPLLHKKLHFTIATYYRLAATEFLPETVDRSLYLDCDIVVNGSLSELWSIPLLGNSAAVIDDMCSGLQSNYERLCYDNSLRYFNAGVMLINLAYWREHKIMEQFESYVIQYPKRILWQDQDVLNAVLLDSKLHVGIEWNYQMGFLKQSYFDTLPERIQEEVLTTSPKIIHYNQLKPWNIAYYNFPYYSLWHYYKKKSPWRGLIDKYPKHKRFNYYIKRWLLWPLGIMTHTDTIKK